MDYLSYLVLMAVSITIAGASIGVAAVLGIKVFELLASAWL